MSQGINITGVWLRTSQRTGLDLSPMQDIEVLVEIDEQWHQVIRELEGGPISHIAEIGAIKDAPLDDLTEDSILYIDKEKADKECLHTNEEEKMIREMK